jgi:hypothetical protein
MVLKLVAIAAGTITLAGCAGSLAEQALAPEKLEARHDQTCRSYGAAPGTERYQNCRLELASIQQRRNAASLRLMETGANILAPPPPPQVYVVCQPGSIC